MNTESLRGLPLIDELRNSAEHTRRTSKGGMEYEARLFECAADALESLLNQAPAVGQAAEGWVVVPREPTERMVIAGFESRPDEIFSPPEEWEAYKAMSGCQQAAHEARLCYAAMLAVAPTALVSRKYQGDPAGPRDDSDRYCKDCPAGEAVLSAAPAAPAAEGEMIHVNVTGGDVFEAPLTATGFADGTPRFVVHVPAQVANDEDRAVAHAYRRWAGMAQPDGLNEPFAEFVRATVDFIAEHSRATYAATPAVEVDDERT